MDIGLNSTCCAPTLQGAAGISEVAGWASCDTRVPQHFGPPIVSVPNSALMVRDAKPLGRFLLLEQIGAGSFGQVWKAHDELLDRFVAIKVAHTPVADRLTAPMLEEARLAAQLRHPNIVRIHELDAKGNSVFIVSDLIDGITLDAWRESRRPQIRAAVEITEKIARALEHAHEQGVVHRDLKPGNVMVGRDDEPYLVDFGLGMRATSCAEMSTRSAVVGTPRYMSPEQARGASQLIDGRTDVYSLGVILYELLTGRTPFDGSTAALLRQLQTARPPSPRTFNAAIPRDLEQICLKSLRRSPSERYLFARELADDLVRFLAGQPVYARPISILRRIVRSVRRRPVFTATVTLLALAVTSSANARRYAGDVRSRLAISEAQRKVLGDSQRVQQMSRVARSPRYQVAVSEADSLRREPGLPPDRCYDLACIYALAATKAEQDADGVSASLRDCSRQWRSAAMEMLSRARNSGYFESPDCRHQLVCDPDLESLQNRPDFREFVSSLKDEQT